jgi:PhzF family phenazine biosynthesis protein
MGQPICVVDAFADRPFTGKPAGVCMLEKAAPEAWMQGLAAELNLSETAFLYPGERGYHLRWFTPTVEVALCGHATLASAHALFEDGRLSGDATARFETKSGELTVRRADGLLELDLPASRVTREDAPPPQLFKALGINPVPAYRPGSEFLVVLPSEAAGRALAPATTLLQRIDVRGVIGTAPASLAGVDFVSRFFAPASGINEDPVTGSAHCALGPFWGARLGRQEMAARQVSARGGTLRVRLSGDRVLLGGSAATVWKGELAANAGPLV